VNQFFVVRNRSIATKHIFAGNSRIASRMVPGTNGTTYSSTTSTTTFPGQGLYHRSSQGLLNGKNTVNNPNYQNGAVTTTGNGTPGNTDNFLYFYHPDHLGSTGFVTDVNGKLYEHIEYFPFGETWVEEHSNTQRTPYLYTGKELDEETGLYYYGARYYDPRTSVWQSADPILGKYLPSGDKERDKNLSGMGGVLNPINIDLYAYGHQNPLRYVDPDGLEVTLNLFRPGELQYKRAQKVQAIPGIFTVGVHTSPISWRMPDGARIKPDVAAKLLAQEIKNSKKWKPGMPVLILGCYSGANPAEGADPKKAKIYSKYQSLAQQVAKILKTTVGGPTAYAWYQEDGSLPIVAPDKNGTDWSLYDPHSKTRSNLQPDYEKKEGYAWYGSGGKSAGKSGSGNQSQKNDSPN
jgi:RHS repeat-associated protein